MFYFFFGFSFASEHSKALSRVQFNQNSNHLRKKSRKEERESKKKIIWKKATNRKKNVEKLTLFVVGTNCPAVYLIKASALNKTTSLLENLVVRAILSADDNE